ncbi:MAG: tRNA dihydrouridine synthase DusB [Candidatus Omnitrophica bacterium]|nr:tRNA dihydrouridine synthase DusB [Candidatus Omnitrophota bacterium]
MAKSIFQAKVLLAPLSGMSDLPLRTVSREHGCRFAFTEMLAIKPLLTKSPKSLTYVSTNAFDTPLGAQIVGRDPAMMAEGAAILEDMGFFTVIDVNLGCPARKVVSKGEGSALLKDPKRVERLLKKVVKAVKIPVTCKIRSGWSPTTVNACEIARIAEGAGIQAITVHGRTKDQGYSGAVDHSVIKSVKECVSIPVIGNGNIFTREDAANMIATTGCDHVMLARGALGNPWIFDEIEEDRRSYPANDIIVVKETLLRHAQLLCDFYGEKKAILLLRRIGCWYFKWFPKKAHYKLIMSHIKSHNEFLSAVEDYVTSIEQHDIVEG